jgi:hypothetical protein
LSYVADPILIGLFVTIHILMAGSFLAAPMKFVAQPCGTNIELVFLWPQITCHVLHH